jgi:hypothetical protein
VCESGGDSETVYLVHGSVLSLLFVEPNKLDRPGKPDEPAPRHAPQKGFRLVTCEIQNVPVSPLPISCPWHLSDLVSTETVRKKSEMAFLIIETNRWRPRDFSEIEGPYLGERVSQLGAIRLQISLGR